MTADTPQPSPLAAPEPWDLVAEAYTAEVTPVFETFATRALELTGVAPGGRVVDVAAGPGTLALLAARAGASVDALDFSPNMVASLRARTAELGVSGITATVGDGMALPYESATFDAGYSMFGLMFFPDRAAGFRELARVLKPGAKAVVSSWVDMERIPVFAATSAILAELTPGGPSQRPPSLPLVDLAVFRAEMSAASFSHFHAEEFSASFEAPSTTVLVNSLERTNAPVALMRHKLGERWPAIKAEFHRRLEARLGPGPHNVEMIANLVVGTRA